MTNPLVPLGRALALRSVRYVLIGVSGANLYAPAGQASFITKDYDLFLPRESLQLFTPVLHDDDLRRRALI